MKHKLIKSFFLSEATKYSYTELQIAPPTMLPSIIVLLTMLTDEVALV